MGYKLIGLLLLTNLYISVKAQIESPVKWSYATKKINSTEAVVFLKAAIEPGWHIYSTRQKDGGPVKTSFRFINSNNYLLTGKTTEPMPVIKYDNAFDMNVSYFERSVVFQQKIRLKASQVVIKGTVNFMACNDHKCIPAQDVEFKIQIK